MALIQSIQDALARLGQAQQQGQTGHVGSWGTKEGGLTEMIAGKLPPLASTTYASAGNKTGGGASGSWEPSAAGTASSGGGTKASSGGGTKVSSGGGGSPTIDLSNPVKRHDYARSLGFDNWEQYMNSVPMESAPAEPQIDWNGIYAPAFEALAQQEAALRSSSDVAGQQLEQGSAERLQGLEGEQASRLQGFGEQRATAQQQTESVIEQARRQASELMQGLQSRYGGTTGTGRFTSEILGAQATRNIAQNQAALQNTLGKIGQAENNLKTEVARLIQNEKQNLDNLKMQLKAQLDQNLASIAKERGSLEVDKANKRMDALYRYQDAVSAVNQRNTQFQQQLFVQANQAIEQLNNLRARAQETYTASLTPSNVSSLVNASVLSPQEGQQALQNTGYLYRNPTEDMTGVIGTQQGQVGVRDDLYRALGIL